MALTKEDLQSIGDLMDEKIDGLARIVASGFDEVNGKFARIDGKFDKIDNRFNQIDGKFDEVNRRFDLLQKSMDEQFASVRLSISRLSDEVEEIKEDLKKERKYTIEDVDFLSDQVVKMENDIKLVKDEIKKLRLKAA